MLVRYTITFILTAIMITQPACRSTESGEAGNGPMNGAVNTPHNRSTTMNTNPGMDLGAFSVSLAVKDLAASQAFYEKLGFAPVGGDAAQNWLILRNGSTTIGLFQGMFDTNILTFNPGWDSENSNVDPFTDVRELQRMLQERGITLTATTDPTATGPGHITLADPDGNVILIDQHR